MWYDALEVARYIITRCSQLGKPISNLKLQKMLYYVWIKFYEKTHRALFFNDICAWQLGPVVPDVYYEYCPYAGLPIREELSTIIEPESRKIIDVIIDKYIDLSARELVQMTHKPGSAWDSVYQGGTGNRKVIPFQLIIEREVG